MPENQLRALAVVDASVHRMKGPPPLPTLGNRQRLYLAARSFSASSEPSMRKEPVAPVVETPLPILNEDLAALGPILHTLGLVAGYRVAGEASFSPVPVSAATGYGWQPETAAALSPAIPLRHPNGRCHGHLGVIRPEDSSNDSLDLVLKAALSLAARAVEERWFRLQHHRGWVVAAAPLADPRRSLLLALDQRLVLKAIDAHALEWIAAQGARAHPIRWEDFFRPVTPLPTLRAGADIPLRLVGTRDGEIWSALLTGPALSAGANSHDALLHARPRSHGLADFMKSEPGPSFQIPSLTPGMRRKIEDYVETHLDLDLSVARLAKAAGMSCSHFTRAFRNALKMTPHRYVMWRRLLRAQELIRNSPSSLAEIALMTGFSDQSHLCRLFQLHVGETPSRFRRRCR